MIKAILYFLYININKKHVKTSYISIKHQIKIWYLDIIILFKKEIDTVYDSYLTCEKWKTYIP